MADYQRLISYIYAYENGRKGKNAGFAKIEFRNGNYKIYLSMLFSEIFKNEGKNSSVQVYLYTREDDKVYKHFLEELPIDAIHTGNQNTVFKIIKKQEAFERPIETYAGLLICTSEFLRNKNALSLIYASEWDDISIKVEEFQEDISTDISADTSAEIPIETSVENQEELQSAELEIAYISDTEYETVEAVTDSVIRPNNEVQINSQSDIQNASKSEAQNDLESEMQNDSQSHVQSDCTQQIETEITESEQVAATPGFFQVLSSCYPKVQIKELGGECIRITPHDISYLPKQYWPLCNNSFLLHGFYNYRYLILCEKTIDGKKLYILAVPGLFHQREQTMARMFGFTEFEGNQNHAPMNFGYWCMRL